MMRGRSLPSLLLVLGLTLTSSIRAGHFIRDVLLRVQHIHSHLLHLMVLDIDGVKLLVVFKQRLKLHCLSRLLSLFEPRQCLQKVAYELHRQPG